MSTAARKVEHGNQLAEVESQEAQVLQEKMQALGIMASGISHDINNPLAIILAKVQIYKEMFESGELSKDEALKFFDEIESTARRIDKIIKDLKGLTRNADREPFEKKNVQSLLQGAILQCGAPFKQYGINLKLEVVDPQLFVQCKISQITQVIITLLQNAFNAIHGKTDSWVVLKAVFVNNGVEFSVTDSSSAAAAEIQDNLSQPFFSTKFAGQGIGLGLSLCKGVVELHKGRFRIDTESKHTRYVIWLPIVQS